MNRVVLNKEEGRWFSRNIIKANAKLLVQSKSDPETLKRKTYKTLSALLEPATEMSKVLESIGEEPIEFDVMLSPKQKRIMSTLISHSISALEAIIPEYRKRGPSHDTYAEDCERKTALLKTMVRKFR